MVGYPDKFRDYSALEIRPDDLYGNVQAGEPLQRRLRAWKTSASR